VADQIRPYGAGFGQYDDFFKAAKVHYLGAFSRFIFQILSTPEWLFWQIPRKGEVKKPSRA
jgi:hypothetical protein